VSRPPIHDVVGVGLGPFNLGLAALLEPLEGTDAVFLDGRARFAWHEGLMLPSADVQVPFLADLVTLADPTSRHSFLSYLHERGRLYRFYFYENMHVPRSEFDAYCRWVAERLPSCRFGERVEWVRPEAGAGWRVRTAAGQELRARHVVLGVGSVPHVPAPARPHLGAEVLHSADYLPHRARALAAGAVTVIGSGQSAAEVFADLLDHGRSGQRRDWFTRSPGFLAMEYSALGLEHFSPEYTAHFHGLSTERRDSLRAGQDLLYKGISTATSAHIFEALYRQTIDGGDPHAGYRARCELRGLERAPGGGWRLALTHLDEGAAFTHDTDMVVLATGHEPAAAPVPELAELAELDERGRPVIERDYRVRLRGGRPSTLFVQNADLHSHGVGAPDLGLGAHRNAVIVNAIHGREVYPVRDTTVFQSFGAPPS
jgi:lysine N6-hydroxylase